MRLSFICQRVRIGQKILLLNRNNSSNISNSSLVNEEANFVISEDEKIKLLALKAKLKDLTNVNSELQKTINILLK